MLHSQLERGPRVQTLAQVDVERVTPAMSAEDKVSHFVKITMLYLEDDNAVDAERFFVKARSTRTPPMVLHVGRRCQAAQPP